MKHTHNNRERTGRMDKKKLYRDEHICYRRF